MTTGVQDRSGEVFSCGPLPPPVHGMALVTAAVLGRLRDRDDIRVVHFDTSPRSLKRSWRYHRTKMAAIRRSLSYLTRLREGGAKVAYIPVDAGLGMMYTLLQVTAARLTGRAVFLHHHSLAYVNRPRALARCAFAVAGSSATHVTICQRTGEQLMRCYPTVRFMRVLSNAFLVPPAPTAWRESGPELRIGHLSNLSREKGLDLVFDTVEAALRANLRCTLHLAGEPSTHEARAAIVRFERRFPNVLRSYGALFGDAKFRFFENLDVFLFPSLLSEIQGIVNLEAMRSGAVPISYGHGCIPSDFAGGAGVVIEIGTDFVAGALPSLELWSKDPRFLSDARRRARARFAEIHRQSLREAEALIDEICRLARPE